MTPTPFRLEIPDSAIADLKTRLALTRFADAAPGDPWQFGASVDYVRDLVGYWKDKFDWRAQEAALNAFPQFKAPLHDIDVHYLHVPGKGPNPYPLLLLHGWPGSVYEFLDIIPRLTDPAKFGGAAKDSFTVIAPSLPGYGLSFKPGQKRFILQDITACVHDLMTQALGIKKFAVQGGDWGAGISSLLAHTYPNSPVGIHINLMFAGRDPASQPTPEEARFAEEAAFWLKEETGYQQIQGTKPQTLAFGLTDSPAGLAAWIAEKFRSWSDCDGVPENAISRNRMARQHRAVLVHRRDRLVVLAVLRTAAHTVAGVAEEPDHRADRLRAIPEGNRPSAALDREQDLHRHPALDRDDQGRSLRSDGTAGRAGARDPGVLPAVAIKAAASATMLSPRSRSR